MYVQVQQTIKNATKNEGMNFIIILGKYFILKNEKLPNCPNF